MLSTKSSDFSLFVIETSGTERSSKGAGGIPWRNKLTNIFHWPNEKCAEKSQVHFHNSFFNEVTDTHTHKHK